MHAPPQEHKTDTVALRKESVDRNLAPAMPSQEIFVALRKESVDRNNSFSLNINGPLKVALRKESVDRNDTVQIVIVVVHSRSPQGERG